MPETFGKRQRKATQERKAAERDARRVARIKRREERANGVDDMSWLGEPVTLEDEPSES